MIYYHVGRTMAIHKNGHLNSPGEKRKEEKFQLDFKGGIGVFWRGKDKEDFPRIAECKKMLGIMAKLTQLIVHSDNNNK